MGTGRRGARLAVTLLVALALPATSLASPSLQRDQSFEQPADGGTAINEGCRFVAQTYTASKTGWLRAIALHVVSESRHDLRVSVREVHGGVPTRVVWSATTLTTPDAELSDIIDLDWPAPQIPGRRYAIVVAYPSAPAAGPGAAQGAWQGTTGDGYTHGEALCSDDDVTWRPVREGFDLRFQTFVQQLGLAGSREKCAPPRER